MMITPLYFLYLQGSGGGYNGLSNIKMEQDGMASLGSMKVSPSLFFFLYMVPRLKLYNFRLSFFYAMKEILI